MIYASKPISRHPRHGFMRHAEVIPLTFGRARIIAFDINTLGGIYFDGW